MPKPTRAADTRRGSSVTPSAESVDAIVGMIEQSRGQAIQLVNSALVDLYWRIGGYLSARIQMDGWGKGTVSALSAEIQRRQPGIRGFSRNNLFRMRQFADVWRDRPIVPALLRRLPWTHHLVILGRSKSLQEQEFYLRHSVRERWSSRELERQVRRGAFERSLLTAPQLAPALTSQHPDAADVFKDSYVVEFLNLPRDHTEADLHTGLVLQMRDFLLELGRDFCFAGSEYPLQVGGRDFALDLLFFHRGLNCLVAIELKIDQFEPAHLGQLNFYLEALDRDVRKPHEKPTIGVLLCASKDNEVVEYALSRSLSPALIAEYRRQLPDKDVLQGKLRELFEQSIDDRR